MGFVSTSRLGRHYVMPRAYNICGVKALVFCETCKGAGRVVNEGGVPGAVFASGVDCLDCRGTGEAEAWISIAMLKAAIKEIEG